MMCRPGKHEVGKKNPKRTRGISSMFIVPLFLLLFFFYSAFCLMTTTLPSLRLGPSLPVVFFVCFFLF
ncbi:hypothetical protein BDV38DRAFT_252290 [Aspergillus pseudotamarii]|uniref:Uncharacterized protein n=1 Tax=Aspergillus pseudotamarii TaxID=132259 RepID=A0A5N6SQM7_ASPPS|nr:uncharacterized protein BDV38DRAFT_252290 [Aspergillus pseudotamarii]KAE8135434.1 hypothetical protein BDV38DRAFT_252290 [Aspergillus pseudotamarii]